MAAPRRTRTYRAELTNRGSEGLVAPYDFMLEFGAYGPEDAVDTVAAILDGRGMVMPPPGTKFELYRLLDKATGAVILQ